MSCISISYINIFYRYTIFYKLYFLSLCLSNVYDEFDLRNRNNVRNLKTSVRAAVHGQGYWSSWDAGQKGNET